MKRSLFAELKRRNVFRAASRISTLDDARSNPKMRGVLRGAKQNFRIRKILNKNEKILTFES